MIHPFLLEKAENSSFSQFFSSIVRSHIGLFRTNISSRSIDQVVLFHLILISLSDLESFGKWENFVLDLLFIHPNLFHAIFYTIIFFCSRYLNSRWYKGVGTDTDEFTEQQMLRSHQPAQQMINLIIMNFTPSPIKISKALHFAKIRRYTHRILLKIVNSLRTI